MSILPEKLRTFDYYKSKLPMYLQNSYGFQEHFKLLFDVMMGNKFDSGVVPSAELALNMLDIFDKDYLSKYPEADDVLNKLANIYNVDRNMFVTYEYETTIDSAVTTVTGSERLTLTNTTLLLLIRAQIIKYHCEGTYEQISSFYLDNKLPIFIETIGRANAAYAINTNIDQDEIFDFDETTLSQIVKLLSAGYFIIQYMGVQWRVTTYDTAIVLRWSEEPGLTENVNERWGGVLTSETGGLWG